jgi:Mg-chelatase subunit ChlD
MKTGLTEIVLVIDRSGSMSSTRADAEGGLRQFIADQKKAPGEAVVTLYRFDDQIELVLDAKPIATVEDGELAIIPRGSTALWAAMYRAIAHVGQRLAITDEAARPEHVIVVTITDGEENASQRHEVTATMVKDAVTRQTEDYKWQFVFIGAGQDAVLSAAQMGITRANAAAYAADPHGTRALYANLSVNTTLMRSGATKGMAWSDQSRDDLLGKKKS